MSCDAHHTPRGFAFLRVFRMIRFSVLALTLFLLASIAMQHAATSGLSSAFSWAFVFGVLYLTPFALLVAMAKRLAHPALFSMAAFLALMGIGGLVRALLGFVGGASVSIGNLIQFIFMSWGLYAHVHFLRKF